MTKPKKLKQIAKKTASKKMASKKSAKKAKIAVTEKSGPNISLKNTLRLIYGRKRLTLLLLVLGFSIFLAGRIQYKDWKNASELRSLTKDFPALVSEIEKAMSVDLSAKSFCGDSGGVGPYGPSVSDSSTCSYVGSGPKVDYNFLSEVISNSRNFSSGDSSFTDTGGRFVYLKKHKCSVSIYSGTYIKCTIPVRRDNKDLAIELYPKD